MRLLACAVIVAASLSACNAATLVQRGAAPICNPTPNPTPGPRLHCGKKNIALRRPSLIQTVNVNSNPDPSLNCWTACAGVTGCVAFAINQQSGQCRLYSKTINVMGYYKKTSAILFYNEACFSCTPPSPTCTAVALATPTALTDYNFTSQTAMSTLDPGTNYPVQLPFSLLNGASTQNASNIQVYIGGTNSGDYYEYVPFFKAFYDLQVVQGQDQGVFYEITGTAPNRTVTFEWRETNVVQHDNVAANSELYNFYLQVFEANSNAVFAYRNLSEPNSAYVYIFSPESGEVNYEVPDDGTDLVYNGLVLDATVQGDFEPRVLPWC